MPAIHPPTSHENVALTGNAGGVLAGTYPNPTFANPVFYNVKEYGAVGNGIADDTVAIQAVIDLIASTGGRIFFPSGTYLIGSPGLILPQSQQKPITLIGQGIGPSVGLGATILTRNGTHPILSASGTGTAAASLNRGLEVLDMTIDGDERVGTLVRLDRVGAARMENVRIAYSGGMGLHGSQIWNSRFVNCLFEECGSGLSVPSVKFDAAADNTEGTNTVHIDTSHFEGNNGTDLLLTGTSSYPCSGVIITNTKFERSSGYGVHFERAATSSLIGSVMAVSGAYPNVYAGNSSGSDPSRCSIIGVNFTQSGSPTADYHLHLAEGNRFTVTGNTFLGTDTAHIRLDSGFGAAFIIGNTHEILTSEIPVSDARSSKTGVISTDDQIISYGAVTTKTKAGAPSDSDVDLAVDGTFVLDSTNHRLYIRDGGLWRYVSLT